jgi:hypothetical protein
MRPDVETPRESFRFYQVREARRAPVGGRKDAVSWLKRFFRRLKIRYERRDDIHQAFLDLG